MIILKTALAIFVIAPQEGQEILVPQSVERGVNLKSQRKLHSEVQSRAKRE
jgi:hypothetical protein